MSSTPVWIGRFTMPLISAASRSASGIPRRLMPTSARPSQPLVFSTIWWARRTSVRSISEADIKRPFSRSTGCFASGVSLIKLSRSGADFALLYDLFVRLCLKLPIERCSSAGPARLGQQSCSQCASDCGKEDQKRRVCQQVHKHDSGVTLDGEHDGARYLCRLDGLRTGYSHLDQHLLIGFEFLRRVRHPRRIHLAALMQHEPGNTERYAIDAERQPTGK